MDTLTERRGRAAIEYARRTHRQLRKYADPVSGACSITIDEAEDICRVDPDLVCVEVEPLDALYRRIWVMRRVPSITDAESAPTRTEWAIRIREHHREHGQPHPTAYTEHSQLCYCGETESGRPCAPCIAREAEDWDVWYEQIAQLPAGVPLMSVLS